MLVIATRSLSYGNKLGLTSINQVSPYLYGTASRLQLTE
jgi:hypothetical protein